MALVAIRRAILDGVMRPGQRLLPDELANSLGVSRTPVREALRKLEMEGLVKAEPWRGVVVAEQRLEDMEEFYAIRGALEGLIARFAARRQPAGDLDRLAVVMEAMRQTVAAEDTDGFMRLQSEFYDQFMSLAGSERLRQLTASVRDYLESAKHVSLSAPNRLQTAFAELESVVAAIRAGDPQRAEDLAREHCASAYQAFRLGATRQDWRSSPADPRPNMPREG